jgi:hypothetical protein
MSIQHIDFLPPKYQEAAALRKSQAWRILVLIMFGGLICAAHLGQRAIRRHVQSELETVNTQYAATLAQSQRLAALETSLQSQRHEADLLTYLRHPWPRTQILAHIVDSLPETIALRRVRVQREAVRRPSASATTVGPAQPQPDPAAEAKVPAVERDLKKLREEDDATQTVVLLEGTSDDDTALHLYLGTVAACGLFTKAELTSLENHDHSGDGQGAHFTARVLVAPAYGTPGGPTSTPLAPRMREVENAAKSQASWHPQPEATP